MAQHGGGEPARSCRKFRDAVSDKLYFVSVTRHGGAREEASADLAVTDGAAAWTATGLTAADLKGQAPAKMTHLLTALSDLEPAKQSYNVEFSPRDGGLLVRVSWQASPSDPRVLIGATLVPAVPSGPQVAALLELLADNLAALRGLNEELGVQLREFEKQASRSQALVDTYVNNKAAQDREMNTKVAALLNSKKKKLRELQQQLAEAQEEIRRLKAGGAEAATEPMDADEQDDEEGEGAAGPSRVAAAGARRGRGRGGGGVGAEGQEASAEEEAEDEEDSSGVDERRHGSPPRDDCY